MNASLSEDERFQESFLIGSGESDRALALPEYNISRISQDVSVSACLEVSHVLCSNHVSDNLTEGNLIEVLSAQLSQKSGDLLNDETPDFLSDKLPQQEDLLIDDVPDILSDKIPSRWQEGQKYSLWRKKKKRVPRCKREKDDYPMIVCAS